MSPFFIAALVLFVVWSVIFLFSKRTRREQAIMSLLGLLVAPGQFMLAATDYRSVSSVSSSLGIEDLLFSFCLFGIAAVVYQAVFGLRMADWRGERYRIAHPTMHWGSHLVIVIGVWIFIALVTALVFHISSIQAAMVGGILVGTYFVADRKDLLLDALLSGLMVAILIFITEQVFFARLFPAAAADFWQLDNLSGILLGGIPVEEILWAAVVGFSVGPCYEYIRRYRLF